MGELEEGGEGIEFVFAFEYGGGGRRGGHGVDGGGEGEGGRGGEVGFGRCVEGVAVRGGEDVPRLEVDGAAEEGGEGGGRGGGPEEGTVGLKLVGAVAEPHGVDVARGDEGELRGLVSVYFDEKEGGVLLHLCGRVSPWLFLSR